MTYFFSGSITGKKEELDNIIEIFSNEGEKHFPYVSYFEYEFLGDNEISCLGDCSYDLDTSLTINGVEDGNPNVISLEDFLEKNKSLVIEFNSYSDDQNESEHFEASFKDDISSDTYYFKEIVILDLEETEDINNFLFDLDENDLFLIEDRYRKFLRNKDDFLNNYKNHYETIIITDNPYLEVW